MATQADTERVSKGEDSAEHKVVWIATRKNLEVAADALGERLLNSHLLHDLLHVKSSLPELSQAWLVAAELPANVEDGFEQLALSFTAKVLKQCPRMLMVVQPSFRRRSNRSVWVTRWNQHRGFKPFEFSQTCSCRVGDGVPGCHVTTYVGTVENFKFQMCESVPSTDITAQSSRRGFAGLLKFFCVRSGYIHPAVFKR